VAQVKREASNVKHGMGGGVYEKTLQKNGNLACQIGNTVILRQRIPLWSFFRDTKCGMALVLEWCFMAKDPTRKLSYSMALTTSKMSTGPHIPLWNVRSRGRRVPKQKVSGFSTS